MNGLTHNEAVERVHVVFKTHLDLGFTDFARSIVARYFEEFIPTALALAEDLRNGPGDERFVWTTGSWLIYEYLEQASANERQRMERAIELGDIAWHGLPFTMHSELMNAALFRYGLSLAARLDRRFSRQTIAAKMTDVPGHTRAIVPLLAEAGIQFLHIGVNPASTAPAVPDLFRWRGATGGEILVMYDRGDYGELTIVPDAATAVCFAHTRDNEGPQQRNAVLQTFAELREQFPRADVTASTLDDVAHGLCAARHRLPIVTDEIGDSWIYGAAADPARMTPYRVLARLYQTWVEDDRGDEGRGHRSARPADRPGSGALEKLAASLLRVPEHTWGLMVDKLEDTSSFEGAAFETLRSSELGKLVEASWDEQRADVSNAVAALEGDRRAVAEQAIQASFAKEWAVAEYRKTTATCWTTSNHEISLDGAGAIVQLIDRGTGEAWAGPTNPLGTFVFEAFSQSDYERFFDQYVTLSADWARLAFTKQGMDARIEHQAWTPETEGLWSKESADELQLLFELRLPSVCVDRFGAPSRLQARWTFPRHAGHIDFAIQWFGKRAIRLPTAAWISFSPLSQATAQWEIHKMGEWVSPKEVVVNGGRMLHGFESGVRYHAEGAGLYIGSCDAAVVSPGRRSLLYFDQYSPPPDQGIHFCLWNNVWNTNFPYWHDRDERFRFRLTP